MIANLAMYTYPEMSDAYQRFWFSIQHKLAAIGIAAPDELSQSIAPSAVWLRPDLVLGQTCGMPYRTRLHDKVTLIGTPDYGVHGCPAGYYHSVLVVRADDPRTSVTEYRDGVFAYNETQSQSGYSAALTHLRQYGFWFENLLHSQAHKRSAQMVADGRADLASLDSVTWRLIQSYEPFAAGLRVLDQTQPTPGLPYIAAAGVDQPAMFAAIRAAMADLSRDDRQRLGLRDLVSIPPGDYLAVPNP